MRLQEILSALAPDDSGGLRVDVPIDWHQGRTLFGGLNAALAGRAARLHDAELGPLRTAQIAFIAPASGALRYIPVTLRRGRSVSCIGVDAVVGAQLCARMLFTYGRARETPVTHVRVSAPEVPSPEDCPEIELSPGPTPAFLHHMELRLAGGSPPLSGGEPAFSWWVRHRDGAGVPSELAALAIADVLPPAVLAAGSSFRPASSVTWTMDFSGHLPSGGDWYLLSSASDFADAGYSIQTMSCFDAAGRLVALSRQTVAIF